MSLWCMTWLYPVEFVCRRDVWRGNVAFCNVVLSCLETHIVVRYFMILPVFIIVSAWCMAWHFCVRYVALSRQTYLSPWGITWHHPVWHVYHHGVSLVIIVSHVALFCLSDISPWCIMWHFVCLTSWYMRWHYCVWYMCWRGIWRGTMVFAMCVSVMYDVALSWLERVTGWCITWHYRFWYVRYRAWYVYLGDKL